MTDDYKRGMLRAAEIARGEDLTELLDNEGDKGYHAAVEDIVTAIEREASATPSPTGKPTRAKLRRIDRCPQRCDRPGCNDPCVRFWLHDGHCGCEDHCPPNLKAVPTPNTTGKPASPGGEVGAVPPNAGDAWCTQDGREWVFNGQRDVRGDACGRYWYRPNDDFNGKKCEREADHAGPCGGAGAAGKPGEGA